MEGDNSQMELSSNMDEEDGGNGVGDHFKHKGKPYMAQNLGQTTKSLCFMAAAMVLIFTIGKTGSLNGAAGFVSSLHHSKITCGIPQGSILEPPFNMFGGVISTLILITNSFK